MNKYVMGLLLFFYRRIVCFGHLRQLIVIIIFKIYNNKYVLFLNKGEDEEDELRASDRIRTK